MHQGSKIGRALVTAAIAAGVALVSRTAPADSNDPPAPEVSSSEVVTASAVVQKIDKTSREVTLMGSQHNELEVKVSPDVNLDRLKIGDRVNATYYQEVAIGLHKSGEPASKVTTVSTSHAGVTARQMTITAKVVSVDTENNMVSVRGTNGMTHAIKVDDADLQSQLKKIKTGDSVDLTYTQAVAISVQPSK